MLRSDTVGLLEALDETSFLLMGTGLLVTLLLIQILWSYRRNTRSGSGSNSSRSGSVSRTAEGETDYEEDETSDEMMLCPECGKPTEAKYRYCRHCVEDTGRSHVGSGGDGESSRSGMF